MMVGRAAHPRLGDGWSGARSSPAWKNRAKQRERNGGIRGEPRKAGKNRAVVASGNVDSVKDASRMLWVPVKVCSHAAGKRTKSREA